MGSKNGHQGGPKGWAIRVGIRVGPKGAHQGGPRMVIMVGVRVCMCLVKHLCGNSIQFIS